MGPLLIWCCVAGLLSWTLSKLLKRAHYKGLPPEAAEFFERLEGSLKQHHPEVAIVGPTPEGFGAVFRVDRQELAVPLGELFLRSRAFPSAFDEQVGRYIRELRDHLVAIDDLPFDEVVARVLPQIRSAEWIRANSPAFGPGRVLVEPLVDDLVCALVIDEPDAMTFVTEGHLDAWGCGERNLRNLALGNLKLLAEEEGGIPVPAVGEAEPKVLHTGDGYDAARVLLAPETLEGVEGLVFGIPDRDTLVVGRRDSNLSRLMGAVEGEFKESEHPISAGLFAVEGGELRSLMQPEGPSVDDVPSAARQAHEPLVDREV